MLAVLPPSATFSMAWPLATGETKPVEFTLATGSENLNVARPVTSILAPDVSSAITTTWA